MEETSVRALELISLCQFSPGLDMVDNFTEVFLCRNFEIQGMFQYNEAEILGLEWIDIDDCLRMVAEKVIQDGNTIIGIALAKNYMLTNGFSGYK